MNTLSEALREVGQRVTPSRLAVLGVLQRSKRPLSVEAIIEKIGKENIDYVTAYRTITTLKHSGLVRQIDFQHNHAHYELSSLGDHHHVVCIKCDKVSDVRTCTIRRMEQQALRESGFQEITEHSLEFFGICKKCAAV